MNHGSVFQFLQIRDFKDRTATINPAAGYGRYHAGICFGLQTPPGDFKPSGYLSCWRHVLHIADTRIFEIGQQGQLQSATRFRVQAERQVRVFCAADILLQPISGRWDLGKRPEINQRRMGQFLHVPFQRKGPTVRLPPHCPLHSKGLIPFFKLSTFQLENKRGKVDIEVHLSAVETNLALPNLSGQSLKLSERQRSGHGFRQPVLCQLHIHCTLCAAVQPITFDRYLVEVQTIMLCIECEIGSRGTERNPTCTFGRLQRTLSDLEGRRHRLEFS